MIERIEAVVPESDRARAGLLLAGHRPNGVTARRMAATRLGLPGLTAPGGIYACASMKEEFGLAILEAMGYGKPVITTRAVGTVDYVRDGVDGLLYELGDAAGLARRIERLATDEKHRAQLGTAAFEAVMEQFTFERHVEAKLAAIRDLARLPGGGPTNHDDVVTIR